MSERQIGLICRRTKITVGQHVSPTMSAKIRRCRALSLCLHTVTNRRASLEPADVLCVGRHQFVLEDLSVQFVGYCLLIYEFTFRCIARVLCMFLSRKLHCLLNSCTYIASHQSNTVLCPEFVICGNSLLKVYDLVATSVNCM